VVAFGTGIGIGYLIGRGKRFEVYEVSEASPQLELNFDATDLAELKEEHEVKNKPIILEGGLKDPVLDQLAHPETVSAGEEFIAKKLTETEEEPEEPQVEVVSKNVFAQTDDDWNLRKEVASRVNKNIYILHRDEFYEDEMSFTQVTLTYYEGDNIVCDEDDTPIYNYQAVIGEMNFGHGSGDPNVFYVRNLKLKAEYEIVKDEGHYSVEVLGLEIENEARVQDLRHSNHLTKFQMD